MGFREFRASEEAIQGKNGYNAILSLIIIAMVASLYFYWSWITLSVVVTASVIVILLYFAARISAQTIIKVSPSGISKFAGFEQLAGVAWKDIELIRVAYERPSRLFTTAPKSLITGSCSILVQERDGDGTMEIDTTDWAESDEKDLLEILKQVALTNEIEFRERRQ